MCLEAGFRWSKFTEEFLCLGVRCDSKVKRPAVAILPVEKGKTSLNDLGEL